MNVEPKRAYQEVGLLLKQQLLDGQYKIGERLPPEREIAEHLGVSRTLVREALIMLELQNLIEVRKGSGVYVLNLRSAEQESKTPMNVAGPFEMLQARQLLESNIAEFAARQVTAFDISAMKKALVLEQQDLTGQSEGEGDKAFHLAVAAATQNSTLIELVEQSWQWRDNNPMWQKLHTRISDSQYQNDWIGDHQLILNAIMRRNPHAAKKAMWQHLENVKLRLMELSDVDDPDFDGYLFDSYPVDIKE
ncbi:MAG: GntR family transcriptional regulator [Shewanella sp.]|uniref:GntR family transcriptional regulator n=1 Tax=Shewanella sp. SNU WT4 TaxID=2590015 RepID=UPI001128153B|nr:GntR family transcriptional regulator [Shewanella sp. SNU WT4]QDF67382.1 GntR family transcriptional regulator [Shewanella sp. SNU WT4]